MAVIVVGGSTRNIGKTSVVAGLIARLPEMNWTAFKVTQYGHGFCTADGRPCQCQTTDSCVAVTPERDAARGTDSARFLAAGAARSFWVRTRIGMLAEAMPRVLEEIERSENAILESNSVMDFLEPDLYLTVVDPGMADFKDSARRLLERADAVLLPSLDAAAPAGSNEKPRFAVPAPGYMSDELVEFVRERLTRCAVTAGLSV